MIDDKMLDGVVLLVGVAVLVVFLISIARGLQTECWRETLKELDVITAPGAAGFGACIGEDSFTVKLTLKEACVEVVKFTTHQGCLNTCQTLEDPKYKDFDRVVGCVEACNACQYHKGCIMAAPKLEGAWYKPWQLGDYFKSKYTDVVAYPASYSFAGDVIFVPGEETEVQCLEFTQSDGKYLVQAKENKNCQVSQCV